MTRRLSLLAAVFATAAVLALAGCGGSQEDETTSDAAEETQEAAAGSTVETAGIPMLLDLGSDSCTACKTMAPILDELGEEFDGRLDVRFIDVRKEQGAAAEFAVKIIPTQIFFDEDGRELFRHQGFYSREDILTKWSELGFEFGESAEGA